MHKLTATNIDWLVPDWPAAESVRAGTTLRHNGVSDGAYTSLNLAMHVGDDPQRVMKNRQLLGLPYEPVWLEQVHSNIVIDVACHKGEVPRADASFSTAKHQPCVVLTADCLPLLVTDMEATCVAAIHAGWRGLVNGIIEATLNTLPVPASNLMVWLGPAIGPQAYEVGGDVRQAFIHQDTKAQHAFIQTDDSHWLMDIYQLARQRLQACGITRIFGGEHCTYTDSDKYFSYRRDNITGRMASIIWLE
jgi:YfiH family protein